MSVGRGVMVGSVVVSVSHGIRGGDVDGGRALFLRGAADEDV